MWNFTCNIIWSRGKAEETGSRASACWELLVISQKPERKEGQFILV